MANVKIYKRLRNIFALALTVKEILTITMFDLQNVCQGHRVEFSQTSFDGNYQYLKMSFVTFLIFAKI